MGKRHTIAIDQKAIDGLVGFLEACVAVRREVVPQHDFRYLCQEDFVLREGTVFERVARYMPFRHSRGPVKFCFANSIYLALREPRLHYVEGYAFGAVIPVHHAWLVDDSGTVFDSTWREPGKAYMGVVFKTEYVRDFYAKEPKSMSLIDQWKDGWPILSGRVPIETVRHPTFTSYKAIYDREKEAEEDPDAGHQRQD